MMDVIAKRQDGSFVAMVNGYPYHVTVSDPLFAEAQAAGANAPMEVPPAPIPGVPTLSKVQWGTFLDMTGFRAAADAVIAAMPKTTPQDKAKWALMKNVISESGSYRQDIALQLVATARAMAIPGVALPTDAEVLAAWDVAAGLSLHHLL